MEEERFTSWFNTIPQSGFSSNDPDDETFLLEKIGKYPGDLPYEVEHSIKVAADIYQEVDSPGEISAPLPVKENTKTDELTNQTFETTIPADGKQNIVEDIESAQPFEKSGLIKEDSAIQSYEKSGLIEEEPQQPFEKAGLVEKGESLNIEKSELDEQELDYDGSKSSTKSIWELFEKEPPIHSTTETDAELEELSSSALEVEHQIETEQSVSAEIVDEKSVIDFPTEVKISDYDKEDFAKILDEDFRNRLIEDIEKSKEKRRITRDLPTPELISPLEIQDLQKELSVEEKNNETHFIEVDLTALELSQPSKIIAQEMKEIPDFSITPSQKIIKKEKKKTKPEKKKKREKISSTQFVAQSEEGVYSDETGPVEDEAIPEEPQEQKKRKVPLLIWFAGLGLLLILIGLFYFIKPKFYGQKVEEGKPKRFQIQKKMESQNQANRKLENLMKSKNAMTTQSEKITPKPEVSEKKNTTFPSIIDMKNDNISQQVLSKTKVPDSPKIVDSKEEAIKKPLRTGKVERSFAINEQKEPVPLIEIVPQKEYAVELFSTFDPEEAYYFLSILTKKQISAYIKVQKVKNANFYKIRVGNFNNINEAKEFAKQIGFKNVWIDRIK